MAAIDDFKAEHAKQHPQRPALESLSDESLVWAAMWDKLPKRNLVTNDARYDPE